MEWVCPNSNLVHYRDSSYIDNGASCVRSSQVLPDYSSILVSCVRSSQVLPDYSSKLVSCVRSSQVLPDYSSTLVSCAQSSQVLPDYRIPVHEINDDLKPVRVTDLFLSFCFLRYLSLTNSISLAYLLQIHLNSCEYQVDLFFLLFS